MPSSQVRQGDLIETVDVRDIGGRQELVKR